MSVAVTLSDSAMAMARQPNEFDHRRIARAIGGRSRYRYVTPEVTPVADGYLIRSACCSRNIDPDGRIIDVALILWRDSEDGRPAAWHLMRRDHKRQSWVEDSRFARLAELFSRLNSDPQKLFWQ